MTKSKMKQEVRGKIKKASRKNDTRLCFQPTRNKAIPKKQKKNYLMLDEKEA